MERVILRTWAVLLAIVALPAAQAAICPRIVHDPSNFVKNTVMAETGIKQVAKQAEHYVTQVLQWKAQVEQLKGIADSGAVLPNHSADSLAAATKLIQELAGFRSTAERIRQAMTSRLDEAKAAGMDWDKYVEWQGKLLGERNAVVVKRAEEEMRLIQLAKREHTAVRSLASQIKDSAGIHESMQQISGHLNMWITQQAELARVMASSVAPPANLSRIQIQAQERRQMRLSREAKADEGTRNTRDAEIDALRGLGR